MEPGAFEFSSDWFSHNIPTWAHIFAQHLPDAQKVLEIGSYEGRSAIWLAENAFGAGKGGRVFCIDTWSGGEEHDKAQMSAVEARFDRNSALAEQRFPGVGITKLKGLSHDQMAQLLARGHRRSFDFTYVDGSHQAPDVLGDLVLAFQLSRVGGVIACDDYLWGEGNENITHRPKLGIDAFTACFAGKVEVLHHLPLYQLYMLKRAD